MNGFLWLMFRVLHFIFWVAFLGACTKAPPTVDDGVAMDSIIAFQKARIAADPSCLSKTVAKRLTIRAVPESAFVNPTDLSRTPPWPYDTTRVYPELHDPVTGQTWIGTECQVWAQILDVGMGAAANYEWSVSYPDRRYRILFAVMTPTKFGWYDQLFARDTGIVRSPRPGWTPP